MSMGAELAVILKARDEASKILRDAGKASSELEQDIAKVNKTALAMGAALAVAAAAAVVSIKTYADLGDAIRDMSQRTGLSVENISELRLAAELSGTTIEALETGVRKMQNTLFDATKGSKEAATAFTQIGLSVAGLAAMSPDEQFDAIAVALSGVQDGSQRAAIATEIFGKAGTQLLPMLADGAEGLDAMRQQARDLGIVFSQDAADAADEFNDTLSVLSGALSGLSFSFAAQVLPSLTNFLTMVINGIAVLRDLGEMILRNDALMTAIGITIAGAATILIGMFAPAIWAIVLAWAAVVGPVLGVIAVLSTVAAAIAVVIDHWSIFEQAGGIVMQVLGNIANWIRDVTAPALAFLGQAFELVTQFMMDRFITIAQGIAILGNAFGADVSGIIGFVGQLQARPAWEGVAAAWNFGVAVVTNTIDGLKGTLGAGVAAMGAVWDTLITRLQRPLVLGQSVAGLELPTAVNLPANEIKDTADAVKVAGTDIDAALRAMQERAEALGASLREALGTGLGTTLDMARAGLADFAKAEWIDDLSARINIVAARIQQAIASGLDPQPVIDEALPLLKAYEDAMGKTAERVQFLAEQTAFAQVEQEGLVAEEFARIRDQIERQDRELADRRIAIAREVAQARIDTELAVARIQERMGQEEQDRQRQRRLVQFVETFAADRLAAAAATVGSSQDLLMQAIGQIASTLDLNLRIGNVSLGQLLSQMGINVNLPTFAAGGIVPGPIGSPRLAVVHGGERVSPVGGSGTSITVNVTGNVYGVEDLERAVAAAWTKAARGGAFGFAGI